MLKLAAIGFIFASLALAAINNNRELVEIEAQRLSALFQVEHEQFVKTGAKSPQLLELYEKLQFPKALWKRELNELSSEDSVSFKL